MSNHTRDRTRSELEKLRKRADLLDNWIRIPGTNIGFGLDGIIGLLPVVGDTATLIAGLSIVARAHKLGVHGRPLFEMLLNVGVDYAFGTMPILGDLFDFFWKSNKRNIRILEKEISKRDGRDTR